MLLPQLLVGDRQEEALEVLAGADEAEAQGDHQQGDAEGAEVDDLGEEQEVDRVGRVHDQPDDPGVMARLYEFPLRAGRLLNEGIRKSLAETGVVTSEWLLESMLVQVFENRERLAGWINDYKAFMIRELSKEEKLYLRNYQANQGSSPEAG